MFFPIRFSFIRRLSIRPARLLLVISAAFLITTASAHAQPPINIVFNIHIEDMGQNHGAQRLSEYNRLRTEVNWLRTTADTYSAKLSLQSNGEYMEYCLEQGHASDFAAYIANGHMVGTHAHPYTWAAAHDWRNQTAQTLPVVRDVWTDNKDFVDRVINAAGYSAATYNNVMCAQVPSDYSMFDALMREFGFIMEGGGRNEEFFLYYGHDTWSAWEPGTGGAMDESLTQNQFVVIPHTSQIGVAEDHGPMTARRYLDNTVPALKKSFLMLYLEWLYRERAGAPEKVWTWGWNSHAQVNNLYRNDVTAILSWLNDNFIGKQSARGNTIANYATFSDVRNRYLSWEAANPNISLFEYASGMPYPYMFPAMASRLWNVKNGQTSTYDSAIATWSASGINAHKLAWQALATDTATPLYILWKDSGSATIDFSSQLGGTLKVTRLTDGSVTNVRATGLYVGEDPVFVEQSSVAMSTVSASLTGSGGISASDGLINCPAGSCSADYTAVTSVAFTATPDSGWTFVSWGGDCASEPGSVCTLSVDSDKTVVANFGAPDIVVTVVSAPAAAVAGDSIPVTVTAGNPLTVPTASDNDLSLYLSADTSFSADDKLLKTVRILRGTTVSDWAGSVAISPYNFGGVFYIVAVADSSGEVIETNEGNNSAASTALTISGQVPPLNSIDAYRAIYLSASRTLLVRALSGYGCEAALKVDGFGAMVWDSAKSRWNLRMTDLPSPPASITVSGPEGSAAAAVSAW
ncbi:MAG: hypothetical protein HZA20_05750 [Nitrospirae bacterium]|nr:hypothetical protein [Nitrospirota bacterium]